MDRRHFLLATIASAAPVKAEPRISEVRLNTYIFTVGNIYVAATLETEEGDWNVYFSYWCRGEDDWPTTFPPGLHQRVLDTGIKGKVVETHRHNLTIRTRMSMEEVMRCCEGLNV